MSHDERMAVCFRALSHPTRARLFRMLATDPDIGRTYRTLQHASGLTDATLVHHLREMERGHLLARRRKGAEVSYIISAELFTRAIGRAHGMVTARRLASAA
jgi:DNA-binding transcriptional ArsR family regulator